MRTITLACGVLLLAACKEEPKPIAKPDRPVLVTTVAYAPRVRERTFVATIRPRIESDLGFRVAGKIARRLVNVGDRVKAGETLAVLDPIDLRLQQEQAEAEIRAANAALTQAEAEFARISSLVRNGWSTVSGLDRQKAATEEARGRVARAERALSLAQNALSYASLVADAPGVVTATLVEPGQVVAAGQAAMRLARTEEKEAVIAVPEAQVAAVREGRASITLWSDPTARYEAALRELAPSADPTTRTYLARFTLRGADAKVDLGMTATLQLAAAGGEPVVRLPLSALFNQGSSPSVWVVEGEGRPVLRPVEVVAYEAKDVLVRGGIADGDKVVTLGVQKIDPAQTVRIVQALQF
ncbi:MAG TPA: efflux RND transporter periplasmic adaptor subunit [Beijerinckiaceae bacterium]|jgi:RND family efflux transporter MFP subunit